MAGRADTRIAILGAGFGGLGAAIKLLEEGEDDFVVLEKADRVGGTWHWNTYPGCQCDIPSHLYSFSFALNPEWSRTYSKQPEIQRYLEDTAERFGVMPYIRFGTELMGAEWDDDEHVWRLETSEGPLTAEVLVAAPGGLSEPSWPEIPGLHDFEGALLHSARWDDKDGLEGKRVAVIGTGASAIQIVPQVQPLAEKVTVFQRTPPWVVPHRDRPVTRVEHAVFRRFPIVQKAIRAGVYWTHELLVPGLVWDRRFLKLPEKVARGQIKTQVKDPELLEKVTPDYTIGCKRILPSNGWYPALQKPNAELVTEAITEVRPNAVVTADGREHEVDVIICATGFHVTDIPMGEFVKGADGRSLAEYWDGSPMTFLSTTVPNYPNLFFVTGPNTGQGHTSLVFMIEAQLRYILGALRTMKERGVTRMEVRQDPYERWNAAIQRQMPRTVWNSGGCKSWYLDRNGRNTTIWPDFTWRFWRKTRRFDPAPYELATRTRERVPA